MEKAPEENGGGKVNRREFLKTAGNAAAFGLGALVFGASRSEGAIPGTETKREENPVPSVSVRIQRML